MVTSIYDFVISNSSLPPQELLERLEEIAPGLFSDLEGLEGGGEYAKCALLYIIHAYSKESKLVVSGQRYAEEKKKIAAYVKLPDNIYGAVVALQSPLVQNVVSEYLEYQGDRDYQHYIHDCELYDLISSAAVKTSKKENGDVDIDGMYKAQKMKQEFRANMLKFEQDYKEKYSFITENLAEIKKMQGGFNRGQSLSVEDSKFIER